MGSTTFKLPITTFNIINPKSMAGIQARISSGTLVHCFMERQVNIY